jgi:hypothetical protein
VTPEQDRRMFGDLEFVRKYMSELYRISEKGYLDTLLKELEPELKKRLAIQYREFPWLHYTPKYMYANQQFIQNLLHPNVAILSYLKKVDRHRMTIEVGNIQALPVEVLSFDYKGEVISSPMILEPKAEAKPVDYRQITFELPLQYQWENDLENLGIQFRILGGPVHRTNVNPIREEASSGLENDIVRQEPNAKTFSFVTRYVTEKKMVIKSGKWKIDRTIVFPEDVTIYGFPGTTLDLVKGAKIISYSPLFFIGTEEKPIVIVSSDKTGEGLAVIKAKNRSILKHVVFDHLAAPSDHDWALTGAVTFYESPVEIDETHFLNNRSGDDYLNIIRSDFSIVRSLFKHVIADAFDGDFVKGTISDTHFIEVKNDGVDVSGSHVTLSRLVMQTIGDKAVSAGEMSDVRLNDSLIRAAEYGPTSKDLSRISISNVTISDSGIGLIAFQKKPEFGAATIDAKDIHFENVRRDFLIEQGSTVLRDGKSLSFNETNVRNLIY